MWVSVLLLQTQIGLYERKSLYWPPQYSGTMTRITRKWEIFQGRNRFYCNGRLMTAPNARVFLLTVFLIAGTSTLFFVFDCKYLAENVTIAIPIIGACLFLFTMSSLLRTSLTDPGIIPRATAEEAAYVEKQIEVTNSANSPTYRPPPRTKEVLVNGQPVKLKYCFTCKLFRPPRASHCSICDNCVDRFDHHCPWVGNCVGRRNYRFFYMFIISLAFLAVFMFACAVAHLILITREGKFFEAVKETPASAVVAVVCFLSVWSVLGLAGFHTYLTTSNQTTNEDIKGSFASKRGQTGLNPYSEGNVCLNFVHILCGPVAPSLIDRRGIVTDSYRMEINQPVLAETTLKAANYAVKPHYQNGVAANHVTGNGDAHDDEATSGGIYRQTTTTTSENAGSVTHLVSNEHPLATAPDDYATLYKSQPTLNRSPVYGNALLPERALSKARSYADRIDGGAQASTEPRDRADKPKGAEAKLDNDLTACDKENSLLSASRLRLLQDTTMIESALDLDSLEDSSVGADSQAGLFSKN